MTHSRQKIRRILKEVVAYALLVAFIGPSNPAFAALTDISNNPLASASSVAVKPNIMYLLDNSGSMAWNHMPDNVSNDTGHVGYKNSSCNSIYYNPNIVYEPPRQYNGNSFSNASFTAAYRDGYATSLGTAADLSTSYYAYNSTESGGGGTDTTQPAYYYSYSGTQTLTPTVSPCTDNSSSSYPHTFAATGGGTWTKVQVSATSGPHGGDERQNFANWYQYYRTRIMMMKGALSRAFVQLTNNYRVGFIALNTGSPFSNYYVPVNDFTLAQKQSWFTTIFLQQPNGSTPMREAVSKIGRYYAGKHDGINSNLTDDPVQYSCQQNFLVLSTDGYWNTGSETVGPVILDGTTHPGNQDGSLSADISTLHPGITPVWLTSPKPLWDGQVTSTTVATTTTYLYRNTSTCSTTASQLQQSTSQNLRSTAQNLRTTSTTTNATTNIIITTVSSGTQLNSITFGGNNILTSSIASSGSNNSARRQNMANSIATHLGTGYENVTAAAQCTGTNAPVTGCTSSSDWYVTAMAVPGNVSGALSVSASSGVTITATNFSGGNGNAPVITGPTPVQTCTPGTSYSGHNRTVTTCSTNSTGPTPVSSCTPASASSGNNWTATTCSTNNTGPTNVTACTPATASSGNNWTTTTCSTVTTTVTGHKLEQQPTSFTTTTSYSGSIQIGPPAVSGNTVGSWSTVSGSSCTYPAAPPLPSPNPSAPTTTTTTGGATGGSSNSLADVTQYYYITDLRPTMVDNVPAAGTGAEDDKATWQHMTTFTIGLGVPGTLNYRQDYKTATVGDFASIRAASFLIDPSAPVSIFDPAYTGPYTKISPPTWPVPVQNDPTAIDDLWHAAVNGRGQYFSAGNPDSVVNGLNSALAGINARIASSSAAATSSLEPVAGDNFAYVAKYTTLDWTGELESHTIDLSTGAVSAAVTWSAQAKLDPMTSAACDNRNIYLFRSGATNNLTPFTWSSVNCTTGATDSSLNSSEQAYFSSTQVALLAQYATMTDGTGGTYNQRAAAAGANMVNFLRGQRGLEGFPDIDPTKLYRARKHVLGDTIDSQPVYVKRPFASIISNGVATATYSDAGYSAFVTANASRTPMVYIGGNDGMLHAFYAGTSVTDVQGGVEAWTFIPTMVLPNLYNLASTNYANNHIYSVDGTPSVGDVADSGGNWKTILVGGLNAGGKGYYAVDVTNPAAPKGLWEFKWSSICYNPSDVTTWSADCHLGYTFGNPVISKLADGTWVVFVTSGYNNVSSPTIAGDGQGYLYVLNALTGKVIYKISTGVGTATTPSGLAKIAAWVDDPIHNNTALRVYGADLLGNIWRFDVNDTIGVAGREASLLATATDSSGAPQPITTKLELANVGSPPSPFVFAATGRYLGTSDLSTTPAPQVQSIYAIKDPMTATPYGNLRTDLKQMVITTTGTGSSATRTVSCTGQCTSTDGWFVDLPESGERVNVDMKLQLGTLTILSNVPENNACTIGGHSWINYFNFSNGEPVATATGGRVGKYLADSLAAGMNIIQLPGGAVIAEIQLTSGTPQAEPNPTSTPLPQGKRVTWREIMQ